MSPRITFYTASFSQNAARTEITLREKGLEFEKIEVDLFSGENKRPPMSDFTPRHQVPTLVYGEGADAIGVYESIATIRFLEDMHPTPSLMPGLDEPHRRAQALMRIEEFQAKLDPKNIFGSVAFRKQDRAQLGKRVDALLAEISRWETYIGTQDYLTGSQFTLADIAVFPLLLHFEVLGFDYAQRAPGLCAFMERCRTRPSVQATGFVDAFTAFARDRGVVEVLAD